ncbi:hypothetical protein AOQ84DRAFT_117568, partial [Glonium stellatum]
MAIPDSGRGLMPNTNKMKEREYDSGWDSDDIENRQAQGPQGIENRSDFQGGPGARRPSSYPQRVPELSEHPSPPYQDSPSITNRLSPSHAKREETDSPVANKGIEAKHIANLRAAIRWHNIANGVDPERELSRPWRELFVNGRLLNHFFTSEPLPLPGTGTGTGKQRLGRRQLSEGGKNLTNPSSSSSSSSSS